MIGKKARKRRATRRDERRGRRATRKDERQDRKLERRQQRMDARQLRAETRQAGRSDRVGMRQETKQTAYEMGIDPNAHWGDTLSGAGDVFSGIGDMVGGMRKPPVGTGTMLPPPSDVVDTPEGSKTTDAKTESGSESNTMAMLGIGAAALLLPKLLG